MFRKTLTLAFALLLVAAGVAAAEDMATVTGTVISTSGDTLVVQTDSGQRTFAVRDDTDSPETLETGTAVTVHYGSSPDGDPYATKIRVAELEAEASAEPTSDSMTESSDSATDRRGSDASELPQTGSNLPLAGLAGLAALGLALGVGFLRRAV